MTLPSNRICQYINATLAHRAGGRRRRRHERPLRSTDVLPRNRGRGLPLLPLFIVGRPPSKRLIVVGPAGPGVAEFTTPFSLRSLHLKLNITVGLLC